MEDKDGHLEALEGFIILSSHGNVFTRTCFLWQKFTRMNVGPLGRESCLRPGSEFQRPKELLM
jgi:hypothetical protein